MSRIAQILVLLLAYTMAPGLAELSESAVHIVLHGDTAHDGGVGHGEADPTDEHGCSGSFHLCTCCHATIVLAAIVVPEQVTRKPGYQKLSPVSGLLDSGIQLGLFRPPIA